MNNEFYIKLKEFCVSYNLSAFDDFIGLSFHEIEKHQNDFGFEFPTALRTYLLHFGKKSKK